jgi:hypothetical protein
METQIMSVLDAPPESGETIEATYLRKERALGDLFAQLTSRDALALHRRLMAGAPADPLASRFGRMVGERRTRLLAFLADARAREARAMRRRP